jgi:hypothetical protein
VSFAVITLCIASQREFIDVYFVIDSVRKLLDTPSYSSTSSHPWHWMEVSGQLHASAALLPVPIGWKAWWAPEPFSTRWWRREK